MKYKKYYLFTFFISFIICSLIFKIDKYLKLFTYEIVLRFFIIISSLTLLFIFLLLFKSKRNTQKVLISNICSFFAVILHLLIFYFPYKDIKEFNTLRSRDFHHIYEKNSVMFHGIFEGDEVWVKTNEHGLRTEYSREEFLKYNERIVVMGDSFTFGFKVSQEKILTKVMENILRKKNRSTAVLNAGIVSYSPYLAKILYKKIVSYYKPTKVLYILDYTDIGDDIKYSRESIIKEDEIYFDDIKKYNYSDFKIKLNNNIETSRFFIFKYPLDETRQYFDNTWKNLEDIAFLCKQTKAQFFLIIAPRYQHWNLNECTDNWEKNEYQLNSEYQYEYFKYFREKSLDNTIKIYDLLDEFKRTTIFPLVFKDDPHWNSNGHRFVGEKLAEFIADLQE